MGQPELITKGKYIQMMRRGTWEFVHRPNVTGIVGIIAITDDNKMVLVEQYRPPVDKQVIEVPAGLAGDIAGQEDEDILKAAERELIEETGYEAQSLKLLPSGTSSAGLSTEVITLVLATGLKKIAAGGGDASESIVVHLVPLDEVESWVNIQINSGKLIDLKIFSGLYFASKIRQ